MVQIIEPLRQDKKLVEYLTDEVKKVGIVFWHGLGDCVQFIHIFNYLKSAYPKIHFDIMIQNNLGQQVIYPDAILLNDLNNLQEYDHDYIFLVHFPVEGGDTTKAELCCISEIGCSKIWEYGEIPNYPRGTFKSSSKLIGIHYQNTALPDVFNPDKEIAEKIWNEVLEARFIPIELDFWHPYHNPVNEKFDFIDCTVRRVKGDVKMLLDLIVSCQGIIAVPSGPLHCALAMMPEKVFYLEKGVPIQRFTYWNIPSIKVNQYEEGKVKEWLIHLS